MGQSIQASEIPLLGVEASRSPMTRLAAVVRGVAVELLSAADTRIVKMGAVATGWRVEIEAFLPNPELTVGRGGDTKCILERSRYRLDFDLDMQLTGLEFAEE